MSESGTGATGVTETGFSLGSNLGERLRMLAAARERLGATAGARLVAQSAVYETDPVGVRPEHRNRKFLNAVLIFEAPLSAAEWLARAGAIEAELGRIREPDRYAPRPIDIDLLYCGRETRDTGPLRVPHPEWAKRLFVVQPLADVRPDLRLPGSTGRVADLLPGLKAGPENVAVFARNW